MRAVAKRKEPRRVRSSTKPRRSPPVVLHSKGRPALVVLDIRDYREMLDKLDDLEDIQYVDKLGKRRRKTRPFEEYLAEREGR